MRPCTLLVLTFLVVIPVSSARVAPAPRHLDKCPQAEKKALKVLGKGSQELRNAKAIFEVAFANSERYYIVLARELVFELDGSIIVRPGFVLCFEKKDRKEDLDHVGRGPEIRLVFERPVKSLADVKTVSLKELNAKGPYSMGPP